MHRLESLLSMAVLLSAGLTLVGPPQDPLKIDASKQPTPPARGRGPFPGSTSPGHSASLPIRLELQISDGPLQPDGTVLADFVITNIGTKTIAVPSSLDGNGPSSDILTLWLTSDAVNDAYAKDTSTGRAFKIEIVPTSAELYGRSNDHRSFLLVAPNQSVKVHASSRVQLQPGTHTATAHAELLNIVHDSSGSSELVGTADSEAVTITLSPANVAGQVQANFQLRNSLLTLHEPVVLVFRAHNVSTTEVRLNLGVAKTEFFRFAVTTPQGATLRNAAPYTEGFHPSGKVVLAAGGDYEQELILNEWFQFNSTGTYALKARLDTSAEVSGTGNVQLEHTDIPFEIKERSPERLTEICSDLAEKVKLAPNAQAAQEPAILLSYLDDPIAIPYLAQLLDAHKLVESAAVSGLERIGNEQSVKILVSALNSEYGETSNLAREALGRILRKSSDPRVKETIRDAGIK